VTGGEYPALMVQCMAVHNRHTLSHSVSKMDRRPAYDRWLDIWVDKTCYYYLYAKYE